MMKKTTSLNLLTRHQILEVSKRANMKSQIMKVIVMMVNPCNKSTTQSLTFTPKMIFKVELSQLTSSQPRRAM